MFVPRKKLAMILHLFHWDKKFFLPFRDLVQRSWGDGEHEFLVYGNLVDEKDIPPCASTTVHQGVFRNWLPISARMRKANKVILHGLFNNHILYLLAAQPQLLKKCHWVIWGGDLYVHSAPKQDWRWRKDEWLRRRVISRLGYLISGVAGDVALARSWYGATGDYLNSMVYPSNIFPDLTIAKAKSPWRTVLVGHSADPSNEHSRIFARLARITDQDLRIVCPLSYGNSEYARQVTKEGVELFGDRFVALTEFLPYQAYMEMLADVDVGIFGFRRQQGMGNIIALLGLGKIVVMDSATTQAAMMEAYGLKIFGLEENWEDVDPGAPALLSNKQIAAKVFSREHLVRSLERIWNE